MKAISIQAAREIVEGRRATYDWLRKVFLLGPSPELLVDMVVAAQAAGAADALQLTEWESQLATYLQGLAKENLADVGQDISLEFTRLFIGPYHLQAPPYESVYKSSERVLMQEAALKVREIYRAAGLQVKRLNQEPDDHIGLEFEFMYYMNTETVNAFAAGNIPGAIIALSTQQSFLADHLATWVPAFCDDFAQDTRHEFFRHLAEFVKGFILEDLNVVRQLNGELRVSQPA